MDQSDQCLYCLPKPSPHYGICDRKLFSSTNNNCSHQTKIRLKVEKSVEQIEKGIKNPQIIFNIFP